MESDELLLVVSLGILLERDVPQVGNAYTLHTIPTLEFR